MAAEVPPWNGAGEWGGAAGVPEWNSVLLLLWTPLLPPEHFTLTHRTARPSRNDLSPCYNNDALRAVLVFMSQYTHETLGRLGQSARRGDPGAEGSKNRQG